MRGLIGSRTLRAAVTLIVEANIGQARLHIPHYWAEFYHDGRGSMNPRNARKLVFFANPADDPRKPTPERQASLRKLTRAEYQEGLEKNRARRAQGLPPFMYVVDSVGPAAGNPFFDELAEGAARRVGPSILALFDAEVQREVDDGDFRGESRTATFDL